MTIYFIRKMDGPNIPAFLQVLTELMDQNNDVRSSAEVRVIAAVNDPLLIIHF